MKYISDTSGGFDHAPYWRYLESVRAVMPVDLFAFAWNEDNHNLTSPNSLHDSWLEFWKIEEVAAVEEVPPRRIDVSACFLGPMHDRRIHLRYKDVRLHTITANHGRLFSDLLVHELRIEREGLYAHELLFAGGAAFTVHFLEFEHRIEALDRGRIP